MRKTAIALFLLVGATALASATHAAGAAGGTQPSCSDLKSERAALALHARRVTGAVEAKNMELQETLDLLARARAPQRKRELERRAEGIRREMTVLLDREHESLDRVGYLDNALAAKRCGGAK